MIVRLPFSFSLLSFSAALVLGGCADDVAITVTGGSSGTTQGTTADMETTGTPTTGTPTTGTPTTGTPTTSGGTTTTEGTSTGTVETSTSSGAVTVTDTDTDTNTTSTGTGTSTSTDSGTTDPDTSTGSTGTTGDTDTGGACMPSQLNCECINAACMGKAICLLDKCVPYTGKCQFEIDFQCDEGTFCAPGTDPFDCCPNQQDGICEEVGMGGDCPVYSDYFDCGYCPFVNNSACDEPDSCPVGTDPDCCATEQDGICEEQSMGGMCEDGSDFFDCGYCPFAQNGVCNADVCPPGTDKFDCCATYKDGVCEEMQFGGMCEDGSDFFDCGYCPFEQNGFCDALCPPDTDLVDCCATHKDGVCEEMQFGGMCEDGTDFFDCGYCPYEQNGFCNQGVCPFDTDLVDCCAIYKNGVCEEMQFGGMCEDGTDFFDCGYCLIDLVGNGVCDVPNFCPPGTDKPDCCATQNDGVCEELQFGGICEDGTDFYDCGYCPYEEGGGCDVPDYCPPGTDLVDCCATRKDGVCEEMQFGGTCKDGTDFYDCGYCPMEDNGSCNQFDYCPPGTDLLDCCAYPEDGICEEIQFGGICGNGTDFFDCGYCPYEDDGLCDAPFLCPPGTDVSDCS